MDTDIDHHHIKSTESNHVSTLWTKLISMELNYVHKNRQLSLHLLNKQIDHSNKIKKLAIQANSTELSASFYYRIVNYINENATNDLRRIIPFINELNMGNICMKSSKKAQYYRKLGNDYFKQGNLNASATAYRTGLLHAPNAYFMSSTSQNDEFCLEGALLHGNLSAVLAHQQLWSSCLEAVLTALELHLNVTNIQNCSNNSSINRLKTRFNQCCNHLNLPTLIDWNSTLTSHKLLEIHTKLISLLINENKNSVKNHWDIPTPKYDHNPLYHGLSNGVRIDTNHEKGRHVIATKSFEPGDIIAVEPAGGWAANRNAHSYHSNNNDRNTFEYLLLLPSQRMNQCLKCFSQLNSVGFVCPYCCDAAYCELSNRTSCNSYCAEISNPSYLFRDFQQLVWHLAECRFMFLLNSMGLGHLCFRLAWLRQHYHHPSADENIDNNPFFTTDQLVEHFTNFHVDELFEYALTGWLISKILNCSSNNDNNKTNLESTNNELIQGLWCFDTLRRLQCNAHAITEIEVNDSDIQTWFPSDQINVNDANDLKLIYPFICKFQQIRIATGLFPCVSLLNHSCDPNTAHNFEESFLILRCLKPILPGTEVFHCYGPHYLHYPSSVQRVTLLQQQYFFICDCEHCSKPVQSLSLSTSITDQQMSVVPANEMLIEWKDTADKVTFTNTLAIYTINRGFKEYN
uniref:SET domain-containing protein n=1 Tax=Schistosoma mansoni TaxID=6183 RepID=A0A5K4FAU9_SCHMA